MDTVAKSPLDISTTGAQGFLMWLKAAQPWAYNAIKSKTKGLSGFGIATLGQLGADAADTTGASASWTDTMKNLLSAAGTAYLTKTQVDNQSKLWTMQLNRAQAGLSPLNISAESMGLPGVNVGLTGSTSNLIMIMGGLLAAVLIIPQLLGKKSRR